MRVIKQEVKYEDDNSNIRITYFDKNDYKISKLKKVDFIGFIKSLNSLTSDILSSHGTLSDKQIDEMVEEELAVAQASLDIDQALTDLKESRKKPEPIVFSGEMVEIKTADGRIMRVNKELTQVETYNSPPPSEMSDRTMFQEGRFIIDPNAMKATSRI